MVNVPRIHCHSAFKHYEMFHCNNSSSYGNSVFNTTYNFNGGTMCGGGFWGGLFGGLGMGLGAGLMNFLGGGLGMFGGGMNMFGGGMGMFGGFPMMNLWGMGGSQRSDGIGGKDKAKSKNTEKENSNNTSTKCEDPDREKLADFNKREEKLEADLKAKKDGSIDTLKALYKEVIAAQKASKEDDAHKTTDTKEYDTLIARLKKLAADNNLEEKDGSLVEKSAPVQDNNKVNAPADNGSVTKPNGNNGASPVSVTTDENGKKQVEIRFAKHVAADLIDDTIVGELKGAAFDDKGNLKYYIVDCNNDDNTFKLRYQITKIDENTYSVRCISVKHHCKEHKDLFARKEAIKFTKQGNALVQTSNETVVSKSEKDGYKRITYVEGTVDENADYENIEYTETKDIDDKKFELIIKDMSAEE